MSTERRTVTVELEAEIEGRAQIAAARRGMSLSRYCEAAIAGEVDRDETEMLKPHLTGAEIIARRKKRGNREAIERLRDSRNNIFKGRPLESDSLDIVREMREERDVQLDEWR